MPESMAPLAERLVEKTAARNIPLAVQVDLTMRCNERCVHCYRVVERRPELSTAEIVDLLGQLAEAGTLYLTLSGGEVFLRRDLFEVVEAARRLRFDVTLKSNALLVTPASARRLSALGVRQVAVSVYSADPAVHDAVTKVPGSLQATLEGVAHLRAAGLAVRINMPLMTVNVHAYRDVRRLAEGLGASCGFDAMITARNDGDRRPVALRITAPQLRAVLADPALNPRAGSPPPREACAPGRGDLDDVPCGAGHNAAYVGAYGDVTPCVAMPLPCGNIRDERFADIWHRSRRMREVRALRVRHLPVCGTCAAAAFCGRCPGQALVETGDLTGPSPADCDHALVAARAAGSPAIPASMLARALPTD